MGMQERLSCFADDGRMQVWHHRSPTAQRIAGRLMLNRAVATPGIELTGRSKSFVHMGGKQAAVASR